MPAPMQTCRICGVPKERRRKFFARLKGGQYDQRCRQCRTKAKKRAVRRASEKRKSAMNRMEKVAVDRLLGSIHTGGSTVPHTAELLESLMQYFGGVNGLAAMFFKQYCDSKPGSSFRTKMLDTAVRLVSKNTEVGGAKKPLELMTAEEIEAEIEERIRMVAIGKKLGRVVDAQEEPIAPQAPPGPVPIGAAAHPHRAADGRLPAIELGGPADGADGAADRGPAAVPAHTAPG